MQPPRPTVVAPARPAAPAVRSPAGEPTGALRERVDAVAQAFRERGAQPVAERWMAFVPSESTRVMHVGLGRDACVGFVAVGRESIANIDLAVHNPAGLRIAQDVRADAHPYVRVCARAGDELFIGVTAVRGAGEITVLTLAEPPVVPPDLDRVLGVRSSGSLAGPRTPRAAIGADPATPDAPSALDRMVHRLAPLGYRRVGTVLEGALETRRPEERRVRLTAGTCYALVAAGGPGVDELGMRVVSNGGEVLAQNDEPGNRPSIKLCATDSGEHRVLLQAHVGAGRFALAVLAMDPAIELGNDVAGLERVHALELAAEGRRRGMALMAPPVRGLVVAGVVMPFPVTVRAGRCYAFGVAPGETLPALDISFVDDRGVVLAAGGAVRSAVRVFVCPNRSMRARVDVRPGGGRGEYLFLAMESQRTAP